MRKPTAIDLFCGCGGLTLGLKKAGFRVVGAVDIDPVAVESYRMNHRGIVTWERDIRSLKTLAVKQKLRIRRGELDLLAGCPPCQGFSSVRTLQGSRQVVDDRNNLISEFQRFVADFEPKTVMLENVPGLARDHRFRELCTSLRVSGYSVRFKILNTADFGIPQRRKRLIMVASRVGEVELPRPTTVRKSVRETIGALPRPGKSGDALHDLPEKHSDRVMRMIRRVPKNGGDRTSLHPRQRLECHKGFTGFKDVYGRLSWDEVSPTITGGCINPSKGRFIHPSQDRALTLREAALLQTFPPRYRLSLRKGKHHAAALIGNALPPNFIMHNARIIKKVLQNAEW